MHSKWRKIDHASCKTSLGFITSISSILNIHLEFREDVIIMQILIETLRLQEDLDLLDEVDPDRVIASLIVDHDVITVTTAIEMLLQSSVWELVLQKTGIFVSWSSLKIIVPDRSNQLPINAVFDLVDDASKYQFHEKN